MHSDDIKPLAAAIDRDRVLRARRMKPADKFLAGEELFNFACEFTSSGIRHQHPDWTPEQVLEEIRRRIRIQIRIQSREPVHG